MTQNRHWLDEVFNILTSETSDLRELASIAGRPPKYFYRGADLRGADLRGQDLRGMDFFGADLSDILVDKHTRIDQNFLRQAFVEVSTTPLTSSEQFSLSSSPDPKLYTQPADQPIELSGVLSFAEELRIRGDQRDAINFLSSYKAAFWPDVEFVLALGTLLEREHIPSAIALYKEADEAIQSETEITRRVGLNSLKAGNLQEARLYLERYTTKNQKDIKSSMLLADVLIKLGDIGSAINLYRSLVHLIPEKGSAWTRLTGLLIERGEIDAALSLIREASERFPESVEIFRTVLRLASILDNHVAVPLVENAILGSLKTKNKRLFILDFEKFVLRHRYEPNIIDIIFRNELWNYDSNIFSILISYFVFLGEIEKAIYYAERWADDPDRSNFLKAKRALATTHLLYGNAEYGISILTNVYSDSNVSAPAKWLADGLIQSGRIDDAIMVLTEAISRYPNEAGPRKWLIDTYVNLGRLEDAIGVWNEISDFPHMHGRKTRQTIDKILTSYPK